MIKVDTFRDMINVDIFQDMIIVNTFQDMINVYIFQDIQHGDLVIDSNRKIYKVCLVCKETTDSRSLIDLIVISPDSLGSWKPQHQLIGEDESALF